MKSQITAKNRILIVCFMLCATLLVSCQSRILSLQERLDTLPDSEVTAVEGDSMFVSSYKILLEQPLDHQDPQSATFPQKIYLSHVDSTLPVVLVTEGYNARGNRPTEITRLLNCNQIVVEHRYFGESVPDSVDWQYLTIEQAANDHHRIIELFKKVYPGEWITTGISKGGQTVMYHSYFFPEDVDVRIPYVAPLNFSEEDTRIYEFLNSVGTEECRQKIHDFQELILEGRDIYFPMFREFSASRGLSFTRLSEEEAFEYSVLEYSFSFWQWGWSCDEIPESDSPDSILFDHFSRVSGFDYFADIGIATYEPFFYQALTEIGYYGYDFSEFDGLLQSVTNTTFTFSAPQNVELVYNYDLMQGVDHYIRHSACNFIFIYGETDTWSATAAELTGGTNSIKIVKPGGSHRTRIRNLPEDQKETVISTLENWLEVEIDRSRI